MATAKIKSTYSLDVDTVRELNDIARHWNVSKSEALRRVIHRAATQGELRLDAIEALDEIQSSLSLQAADADVWIEEVRREREADRQDDP